MFNYNDCLRGQLFSKVFYQSLLILFPLQINEKDLQNLIKSFIKIKFARNSPYSVIPILSMQLDNVAVTILNIWYRTYSMRDSCHFPSQGMTYPLE